MTTITATNPEVQAARARLDGRTETLASALRADYEDSLIVGETEGVEDYLRWVRRTLTGSPLPVESLAFPYLDYEYEDAADYSSPLHYEDAERYLGRNVIVRFRVLGGSSLPSFTGQVIAVDHDREGEYLTLRHLTNGDLIDERVYLHDIMAIRTIDVHRGQAR